MTKRQIKKREEARKTANKQMMEQLKIFSLENDKCSILKEYLERNKIYTIAIYGGGQVGEAFCKICIEGKIKVAYIIDKFVSGKMAGIPIYQFRFDFLPEVDAVILVPCHEKDFIKFEIRNYFTDACQLLGLDDCLREMGEKNET